MLLNVKSLSIRNLGDTSVHPACRIDRTRSRWPSGKPRHFSFPSLLPFFHFPLCPNLFFFFFSFLFFPWRCYFLNYFTIYLPPFVCLLLFYFIFLSFSSLSCLLFSARCSHEFSFFPTFIFSIAFPSISIFRFVISWCTVFLLSILLLIFKSELLR